ncbi:hypothetical protein H8E88_28220 [candidate division KSB1 bacterium]|nr:hypothetical protein [candidate division KSB1 bacterium]
MYLFRKLKPNERAFLLVLVLVLLSIPLIYIAIVSGPQAGWVAWGFVVFYFAPFTLLDLIRTKNYYHLFPLLFQLLAPLFALIILVGGFYENRHILIPFIFCMVAVGGTGMYFILTRKIKWRYREVLELAALPIKDTLNGFTNRPRVAGKADFTKHELESFSKFIAKNMIAIPYSQRNKVTFLLAMKIIHKLGMPTDFSKYSYVAFDYDGNITVNIGKNDYLKYRDQLTFDQLCESLGQLFNEFFELFKKGEGVRIIDRMNNLKLNPFEDFAEKWD